MAAWVGLANAQDPTGLINPLSAAGQVDPNELFARVAKGFLAAIGAATIFFTVLGGYIVATSAGNAEQYAKGKKTIAYALIGFIIVIGSYALISIGIGVITDNKGLPAFERFRLTDPLKITSPADLYGGRLAGFFVSGLGAITVLMLIYGGLQWMIGLKAGKGKEAIFAAKTTITRALIGVLIVLSSYALITFAYKPIVNLLRSGTVPVQNPTVPPDPADTQQVACFRLEVGKDIGATCEVELYSACLKARDNLQRGQADARFNDCSQVGACVQNLPGTGYKNRIKDSECQEGSPSGYKVFNPISEALTDGSCPFGGTIAVSSSDSRQACYAEVSFNAGIDWPLTDRWACVRQQKTTTKICSGGATPGIACAVDGQCGIGGRCVERIVGNHRYDCDAAGETRNDCRRETTTHFYGNFYGQIGCAEIGYCEMSYVGHYNCKNGVVEEMCRPFLFPAIGVPIPPFGCAPYEEINGQCYVGSGITWHSSVQPPDNPVNSKYCPRRP